VPVGGGGAGVPWGGGGVEAGRGEAAARASGAG